MYAIETESLTKRFGDVLAVCELDLAVPEGAAFGFLGPNGAGKSTTIDVLLGYVRPTSGSARLLGRDVGAGTRRIHGRIGVLPDGYDLYGRLTGREHVAFAADSKGAADDPDALLSRVGLSDAADRRVAGYSKGMRGRLALAMALAGHPDLLVLDEPTAGLDPNGVALLREIIAKERDRGATVFLSSHRLEQVEAVCDRVAILREGRLVAEDTIAGLRESVGAGSRLTVSVAGDPEPHARTIDGVDGVTDVTVDGHAIHVACDPGARGRIIERIEAAGGTITDVASGEVPLSALFAAYAGGGS